MLEAFVLLVLGIGGTLLAATVVCSFLSHRMQDYSEKTCQLNTYFTWIANKGSEQQKKIAETLKQHRDLEGLKSLVGDSFLVDQ